MSNLYGQNLNSSPARAPYPTHIWSHPDVESLYLEKLLEEKKSLAFYLLDLPICNELLNQEILRVSEMMAIQSFNYFDRLQINSPNLSNPLDMMHMDMGFGVPIDHGNGAPPRLTKKFIRVDVPVDKFPDFNFVGRLLGPRGNSLKRIEVMTGCRVFIRGRGSIKDPQKEERLRGRPGHGHLNEPLHIVIEAEFLEDVVDAQLRKAQEIIQELLIPVNKSGDVYKRQQLRELAILRENTSASHPSSSSAAMTHATTARKGTSIA